MDLITHGVVGLALGSLSGGPELINNPLAIGSLIGSVIPDGDIIYRLKGDYTYLKNHRGPSHSVVIGAFISSIISIILRGFFSDFSFWSIFLWTFGGYMLHIGLDIFNSYGANILWPFSRKKIESGLLLIFDPALLISAGAILYYHGTHKLRMLISMGLFVLYMVFRWFLKRKVYKNLNTYFQPEKGQEIVVMPSMLRLFKWDFILYQKKRIITGRVNVLRNGIEVRDYLERSSTKLEKLVMDTNLGRFFKDFSPHYHVEWIEEGENHKAVITDLRYFIKGSYMHHGIALFNEKMEPIYFAFQPYNSRNAIPIPV